MFIGITCEILYKINFGLEDAEYDFMLRSPRMEANLSNFYAIFFSCLMNLFLCGSFNFYEAEFRWKVMSY